VPLFDPTLPGLTRQLHQCESQHALDLKLTEILKSEAHPADADERLELAVFCQRPYKKRYALAARLYAEALDANPALAADPGRGIRYNAGCAASLAGCGKGKDVAPLDDTDRARLRQQAHGWLAADLVLWTKQADSKDAKIRAGVRKTLQHWQNDPDLAGVRESEALIQLPEAERDAWRKLWAEVAAVDKAAGQP
jgi:hypothetical protein